ncbi:hypothetical protein [Bacillus sp. CGMCC 1.16541]|uniref:hypothetical protein n=1 Tax=Bacillus sp. CGMCC 1.16541 TaxID=2185143 RepID=UPI000D7259F7|nr:hypothetical protein [Bacillus sp. CGMCC 1.16541]
MSKNTDKNKLIINEIQIWKESKILPEHYCDYLLMLYTKGERDENQYGSYSCLTRFNKLHLLFILLFLPFELLVIYFTELSFVLQMVLSSIFILISFLSSIFYRKEGVFLHTGLTVSALLLLVQSHKMVQMYFYDSPGIVKVVIFIHCLLWLALGKKFQLSYFIIASVIGIVIILISLLL